MALEDIPGYSVRRGLGSGSAGAVWLVRDLGTGRHAVLKRLPSAVVPAAAEFRRDLALAQGVNHPHLARLIEVRQTEREWLLLSQYVGAGTLSGLLERRGPLSAGELVTLISPLAQGLGALHRAGLTHGHLGAGDVMLTQDGRPVITDAGLRLLATPAPGGSEPDEGAAGPGTQPSQGSVDAPRLSEAEDLKALRRLALQAGGAEEVFSAGLFEGDGEQVAQRILGLTTPEPINLGFGEEAATDASGAPPDGAERSARPRRSRLTSGDGSSRLRLSSSGGRLASSGRRVAKSGGRVAESGGRSSRPGGRGSRSGGLASRSGGQARRRSRGGAGHHRTAPARRMSRRLGGHLARCLRSRRPVYGALALAGLAVLAVLGIGLGLLGVLGGPISGAAAADSQGQVDGSSGAPGSSPSNRSTPSPGSTSSPGRSSSLGVPPSSGTTRKLDRTPLPWATPRPGRTTVSAASEGDAMRWLETLQALDVQRSRAFAGLDAAGLDAIYVPGSPPWRADRSLLASYRDQALQVVGLRLEIDQLEVERSGTRTVVLRVVDRLTGGTVVDSAGRRTDLPAGRPTARRITLAGEGDAWRISGIAMA